MSQCYLDVVRSVAQPSVGIDCGKLGLCFRPMRGRVLARQGTERSLTRANRLFLIVGAISADAAHIGASKVELRKSTLTRLQ